LALADFQSGPSKFSFSPIAGFEARRHNFHLLQAQVSTPCHFLVIENNSDEAFLIQRAFGKVPYPATVFICGNVSEAIRYLEGGGSFADRSKYPFPYAIISDLHMPVENGLDFLRWMGADARFKQLPVIILTGSSAPDNVKEAYDLGAAKVLTKPPNLPGLSAMINQLAEEWCTRARCEAMRAD
jgi:CheY-like chemotaxis protein